MLLLVCGCTSRRRLTDYRVPRPPLSIIGTVDRYATETSGRHRRLRVGVRLLSREPSTHCRLIILRRRPNPVFAPNDLRLKSKTTALIYSKDSVIDVKNLHEGY